MIDLIFDVRKEDQTTMHAKEPSQQYYLQDKKQVLDQLVDGGKWCICVGFFYNMDVSDSGEGEICEFLRNTDRLVEEERMNNIMNGSSREVIDVFGETKIHWVPSCVVKHVKEEFLDNVQKVEMRGGLDFFLNVRSEYAKVTVNEDIAFINVHKMFESVINVNDRTCYQKTWYPFKLWKGL